MQQNLAAVLAQVNLQQPQDSKLLVKAITAHDPQARLAPLNSKQMAAYHTLEDWVQTTLAKQPATARAHSAAGAATARGSEGRSSAADSGAPPSAGFAAGRPTPAQTTPVDEFDPLLFNGQSQPPRRSQARRQA